MSALGAGACCGEESLRGALPHSVAVGDVGGGEGCPGGQLGDFRDAGVVAGAWCAVAGVAGLPAGGAVLLVVCAPSGFGGAAGPPGAAVAFDAGGQVSGGGVGADG